MHNYCYTVRLYDQELILFQTYFNANVIFLLFSDNCQHENDHDWLKRVTYQYE
jgi:hypothetical protein